MEFRKWLPSPWPSPKNQHQTEKNMSQLPTETLIQIFDSLGYFDLVLNVKPVCRRFKSIIDSPTSPIKSRFRAKCAPGSVDQHEDRPVVFHDALSDLVFRSRRPAGEACKVNDLQVKNVFFTWSVPRAQRHNSTKMSNLWTSTFNFSSPKEYKWQNLLSSPVANDNATYPPIDAVYYNYCKIGNWDPAILIYRDPSTERGLTVAQLVDAIVGEERQSRWNSSCRVMPEDKSLAEQTRTFQKGRSWTEKTEKLKLCEKCKENWSGRSFVRFFGFRSRYMINSAVHACASCAFNASYKNLDFGGSRRLEIDPNLFS